LGRLDYPTIVVGHDPTTTTYIFFPFFYFFSEEKKKYIGKWWFGKYIESCRGLENGSTLHHVVPMV
jgi:hypothetical protein